MRGVVLVLALGLALLAVPQPAAAVLCNPTVAVESPMAYANCQFGCELGAVHRFLASQGLDTLFVACPT